MLKKIAVFVSGGGSNLQSLIDSVDSGHIKGAVIEVVFSDRESAYGLERARRHSIAALHLSPAGFFDREAFDRKIADEMNLLGVSLVCLAGYMRILTKAFIDTFKGVIMNIHPALLPKYGGAGMYGRHVHEAVIAAGESESGCTVHFVDYGTDTGPVILQKSVPVEEGDTPESLAKKVLALEHEAYPEAVKLWAEERIKTEGSKVIITE